MNLADIINGTFYALDTPGALTRGVLSGRPGERVDGRDFLESWGAVGPNQAGLDLGDVAGYAAGVATDPLSYVSGGALLKGAARAC